MFCVELLNDLFIGFVITINERKEDNIMTISATILGTADSTHYLVGSMDSEGNFTNLPQLDNIAVCDSLKEAKALLVEYNYTRASLKLNTAYDEMCGMPASAGLVEQNISL